MISCFIVKIKVVEEIKIEGYVSKYLKDSLQNDNIIVSKFFKKDIKDILIERGEVLSFRIVALNSVAFQEITAKLFRCKLFNQPFILGKISSHLIGIYSNMNDIWTKNWENMKLNSNVLKLKFHTPLVLKHGSRFIERFDSFLFFKSILKGSDLSIRNDELLKMTDSIVINTEAIYLKRVDVDKKGKTPVIFGEVIFKMNNLDDKDYTVITNLLKLGFFIQAGYEKELGYGMYSIENCN